MKILEKSVGSGDLGIFSSNLLRKRGFGAQMYVQITFSMPNHAFEFCESWGVCVFAVFAVFVVFAAFAVFWPETEIETKTEIELQIERFLKRHEVKLS